MEQDAKLIHVNQISGSALALGVINTFQAKVGPSNVHLPCECIHVLSQFQSYVIQTVYPAVHGLEKKNFLQLLFHVSSDI